MIFLKLKYHIAAVVKKLGYHLLFGRQVSFGRRTTFRSGFHLIVEGDGQIEIGERCFFNHDCSVNCLNKITIGSGTIFGEGVRIYDHNHRFSDTEREIKAQGYVTSEVHIGSHCWIGSNVVILRKADIGDHCVIGAGCVVNEKVPAGSIVHSAGEHLRIEPINKKDCGT